MPDLYSPWMDAAGAVNNASNAFNRVIFGLAQQKFQRQYRDQQNQIAVAKLLQDQMVNQAQIKRLEEAGLLDRDKRNAAEQLGTAEWTKIMRQGMESTDAPDVIIDRARAVDAATRSAALSGDVASLFGHNIPANNISQNFITGEMTPGMTTASPGESVFDQAGRLMAQGLIRLGPREQVYQPTVEGGVPSLSLGAENPMFGSAAGPTGEVRPADISSVLGHLATLAPFQAGQTNLSSSATTADKLIPILVQEFMKRLPQGTNAPVGTNSMRVGRFKVTPR